MNNITPLAEQLHNEFSINENGQAFCTIRGLARLCGVDQSGLSKALKGEELDTSKMGKFLTSKGFEGEDFFTPEGIPDTIATLVIEYYAFEAGARCKKEAQNVYRAFAAIGFRTWVQESLGWFDHAPTARTLPQRDSVEYVYAAEKIVNLEGKLPEAVRQLILDKMGDELCTGRKQLQSAERWVGVAQKAEEMGHPVTMFNRSMLGKYVKKFDLDSRQEERLCNGQMRPIYVYRDSQELENAINCFFEPASVE